MLALWNILIAMQLVTMIATPICVLLFIHPQVTVLCIILLLMVSVSLMLIAAYLYCINVSRQDEEEFAAMQNALD